MVRLLKNTVCFFMFLIIVGIFLLFLLYLTFTYEQEDPKSNDEPKIINNNHNKTTQQRNYTYRIIKTYPHDRSAFTQGLVFEDGYLFEGTGLRGESSLRKVDLETGRIIQSYNLSFQYFGEGITIFDDKIYQLTWTSRMGFVYDKEFFNLINTFNYSSEGWGLTHDNNNLIMSDGSATLYFLDPNTFKIVRQIKVTDQSGPVKLLNELEYINGSIYANIWQTNSIIIINPLNGNITGRIDLDGLLSVEDIHDDVDVLNGIAYDEKSDRLFVTGKRWPKLFEIELILIND